MTTTRIEWAPLAKVGLVAGLGRAGSAPSSRPSLRSASWRGGDDRGSRCGRPTPRTVARHRTQAAARRKLKDPDLLHSGGLLPVRDAGWDRGELHLPRRVIGPGTRPG